jgi:hypothetical protein
MRVAKAGALDGTLGSHYQPVVTASSFLERKGRIEKRCFDPCRVGCRLLAILKGSVSCESE